MATNRTKNINVTKICIDETLSTAGTGRFTLSSPSSASHRQDGIYMRQFHAARFHRIPEKILKNAIYNHLRFLRARGETQTSPENIARALNIPVSDVRRLTPSLKGVKVA